MNLKNFCLLLVVMNLVLLIISIVGQDTIGEVRALAWIILIKSIIESEDKS